MALNFQQVFEKIREISSGARLRQEHLNDLRQRAADLLTEWGDKTTELQEKVDRTLQFEQNLRCALPLHEPLNYHEHCEDLPTDHVTLIAADGSQIVPDRHAPILFGLINVGAIILGTDNRAAPHIETDSELSFDEEVVNWTEALLA